MKKYGSISSQTHLSKYLSSFFLKLMPDSHPAISLLSASPSFTAGCAQSVPNPSAAWQAGGSCRVVSICCSLLFTRFPLPLHRSVCSNVSSCDYCFLKSVFAKVAWQQGCAHPVGAGAGCSCPCNTGKTPGNGLGLLFSLPEEAKEFPHETFPRCLAPGNTLRPVSPASPLAMGTCSWLVP